MSADLLYGMEAIGQHVGLTARQVEHLVAKGELPTFKMGRTVCARRSGLARSFAMQERGERVLKLAGPPRPGHHAPGRPATVISGVAAIAARLSITEPELVRLDAARAVPTYMAGGVMRALAAELTIYLAERNG